MYCQEKYFLNKYQVISYNIYTSKFSLSTWTMNKENFDILIIDIQTDIGCSTLHNRNCDINSILYIQHLIITNSSLK